MTDAFLPRLVSRSLADRLHVMPAVAVTGARQTGKSTLVQRLASEGRRYWTLDDLDVMDTARRDPELLVGGAQPVALDEVQREPDLLRAVKRAIDRRRRPGQFLLAGSANLLLMRHVSESPAGRASYLTLWPMTRREQRGLGRCGVWEELLETEDADWLDLLSAQPDDPEDWRALARRGGFPTPLDESPCGFESRRRHGPHPCAWDGDHRSFCYLRDLRGSVSPHSKAGLCPAFRVFPNLRCSTAHPLPSLGASLALRRRSQEGH
ncbi:MAG: ATP-binding protein [Gemmatimonadales bacterium]